MDLKDFPHLLVALRKYLDLDLLETNPNTAIQMEQYEKVIKGKTCSLLKRLHTGKTSYLTLRTSDGRIWHA